MAANRKNLFKLYERQRSHSLAHWLSRIGEVETLIDEAIENAIEVVEKGHGELKPETEEGRLRLTYTLRLLGNAVVAVAETPIATDELQRRYREAGFESLTLHLEKSEGATVTLVAYDDRGETEPERLTRLLAEALRRKAGE